jgi:hypothetical protein
MSFPAERRFEQNRSTVRDDIVAGSLESRAGENDEVIVAGFFGERHGRQEVRDQGGKMTIMTRRSVRVTPLAAH